MKMIFLMCGLLSASFAGGTDKKVDEIRFDGADRITARPTRPDHLITQDLENMPMEMMLFDRKNFNDFLKIENPRDGV